MPQAERAERTRIQLCGRLSVEIDGAQVADGLRGRQVRLLLAYLVLNRARQVSREELIDVLWPFQPPRSEDAALRTVLSRLRSAVGAGSLAGRHGLVLALPEPVWVDVEAAASEIQRARQALAGGDAVGYAKLRLSPARPGAAAHAMTAVKRAWRGRGVASALKRAQIRWALEHGLEVLETTNELRNAPMRRINEKLGYAPAPGRIHLRGPLAA